MIVLGLVGLLFGLIAGPMILYACGVAVLKYKRHKNQVYLDEMRLSHNEKIRFYQKEYDRHRKEYTKTEKKMQKILAKARNEK